MYNEIASASPHSVHLRCGATYVSCIFQGGCSRERLAVSYTPLFVRRFRRLRYTTESCRATSRRCVQNCTVGFVCVHMSLSTTLATLCLSSLDRITGVVWQSFLHNVMCSNFFYNRQLLTEWHGTKLWEWILVNLLNFTSHTD